MGNGSRGGNGGLSSTGRRQRDDKARRAPRRHIERETNPGRSGERRGAGNGSGGSGGRGRRNINWPNGIPNFLTPHLHVPGSGGSSGKKKNTGKKTAAKKPPAAKKQQPIKKINRIKPIRVKLTKQRKNKTPN